MNILKNIAFSTLMWLVEQGGHSGESARLPRMWPGLGVISGLSMLVPFPDPRGFSPGNPVLPRLQKATSHLIWFDLRIVNISNCKAHYCKAHLISFT